MNAKTHYLVTGGAGFIGSHLCQKLLHDGHKITCLDNFHTGSRSNIYSLLKHEDFELIHQDVVHPITVNADAIINLACPGSPVHYQYNPVQTTKTNVLGTMNLLELARQQDIPFFQASTSEVYGCALIHPQPESYWGNVNPIGTRACYDEGKRCAETLCFDYHRQHRTKIKVARLFNTYGPRMQVNDGRVVSNFIIQALKGDPISIYGDGSQTRSLCFIDDMVDAICLFLQTKRRYTGPLNLGNPHEISISELADRILTMTGSRSKVFQYPLPPDDPPQRRPDITQAINLLGWEPSTTIDIGLQRCIEYFKGQLGIQGNL